MSDNNPGWHAAGKGDLPAGEAGEGVDEAFRNDNVAAGGDPASRGGADGDDMGLGALAVGNPDEENEEWENELDRSETPGRLRKLDYSGEELEPRGRPDGAEEGRETEPAPEEVSSAPPPSSAAPGGRNTDAETGFDEPGEEAAGDGGYEPFPGLDDNGGGTPPTRRSFDAAIEAIERGKNTDGDGGGQTADGDGADGPGEPAAAEPTDPPREETARSAPFADGANGGGRTADAGTEAEEGAGEDVPEEDFDEDDPDEAIRRGGLFTGIAGRVPLLRGEQARKRLRQGAIGLCGSGVLILAAYLSLQSWPGAQTAAQAQQATDAMFAPPETRPDEPVFGDGLAVLPEAEAAGGPAAALTDPLAAGLLPAALPASPAEERLEADAEPAAPGVPGAEAAATPGGTGTEAAGAEAMAAALALLAANGGLGLEAEGGVSAEELVRLRDEIRGVSAGISAFREEALRRMVALEARQIELEQAQEAVVEAAAAQAAQASAERSAVAGAAEVPRGAAECDALQRGFLDALGQPLQAAVYGDAAGRRWVRLVSPLLQRSVRPGDALPAGSRDAVVQIDSEGAYIEVRATDRGEVPCVISLGV